MATARMKARDRKLATKFNSTKRDELRSIIKNKESSPQEIMAAVFDLQKRPVDESPTRRTRRCSQCGRPRGVYRKFGLCRCCLRHHFTRMCLPGLVKSSW
jgi:small subunit ribosomal protein S14